MKDKVVLVIGGEGFVGSSLIDKLRAKNDVISLDNKLNTYERARRPGVRYLLGDAGDVASLIPSTDIDIIFHMGEYSRVENSFEKLPLIIENNYQQFPSVCEYAFARKAKFIYSASSTAFAEDTQGYRPSPYQVMKSMNVNFLNEYSRLTGLNFAITYFYNVYGPGEVDSGEFATVVGRFLKRRGAGKPLRVVEPGTQKRNFTHIYDIVDALELIGTKGEGDHFGIGSDDSYSIIELAKMISENVEMVPARFGNRQSSELKYEKTKALGWEAKFSLETYVNECLK